MLRQIRQTESGRAIKAGKYGCQGVKDGTDRVGETSVGQDREDQESRHGYDSESNHESAQNQMHFA